MTIDKKTIRKVFVVVVGAIFFYWLLHETDRFKMLWGSVSGVVAPFAIGSVLAFIANVPMRAIENRLGFIKGKDLRRTVAILLTFVAIILVVYGVIRLLLPQISETIMLLIPKITDFAIRAEEWILGFAEENPQVLDYIYSITGGTTIDWPNLIQQAATLLKNSLSVIASGAVSAFGSIAQTLVNIVIGLVFSVYCLARKDILASQGRKIL